MKSRDYQQKAIDSVLDSYRNNIRSGILNLHVGAGKTYVAGCIIREMKKIQGKKALFLVAQRELAFQARKAFQRMHPDLRIAIEMADLHASPKDDIVIACVATLGRAGSMRVGKFNPDDFGTILVDECHLSLAPVWNRVLNWVGVTRENFQDNKLLLGLTGTAFRHDGTSLGVLYDDVFYTRTIADGIKDGWLTDIEWIQVETDTDISEVPTRGGEFVNLELLSKIDNPLRNGQIINAYKEHGENKTCLVFAGSVEHAYKLADLFNAEGIKAVCIEGGTEEQERKDVNDIFRDEGDLKVIVNYGVYTTGVDFPELGSIILGRPIKSTVLYTQIVGRVLRPSDSAMVDYFDTAELRRDAIENSLKPTGKVIDFMDNIGKHNVCTLPVLFGVNPKVKTKKRKFFEEVVEVLEEVRRERKVDIQDIVDPDNITLEIKKTRFKLTQLEPDEYIKKLSKYVWLPIKEAEYELNIAAEGLSIMVEKNLVDKYEVFEVGHKSGVKKLLQTFGSLAGAIKIADEYVEHKQYDMQFAKQEAWLENPPSPKQVAILYKMFGKKGMRFTGGRYENGANMFTLWGENINTAGKAAAILNQYFNKKK